MDMDFRVAFGNLLELHLADLTVVVSTQKSYQDSRPDIELDVDDRSILIFIECKIEATEHGNQLKKYRNILEQERGEKKVLVYLTKYYYQKQEADVNLCWYQIYEIIDDNCQQITKELKLYLEMEGMANSNKLDYTDLLVIQNMTGTLTKMDAVLDECKRYFEEHFQDKVNPASRSSRISEERYVLYHSLRKPGQIERFSIEFGFMWWEFWGDIYVGLRIFIPVNSHNSEHPNLIAFFAQNLPKWNTEDWREELGFYEFSSTKLLAKFLTKDQDQTIAICAFIKKRIDMLVDLKRNNPKIFS